MPRYFVFGCILTGFAIGACDGSVEPNPSGGGGAGAAHTTGGAGGFGGAGGSQTGGAPEGGGGSGGVGGSHQGGSGGVGGMTGTGGTGGSAGAPGTGGAGGQGGGPDWPATCAMTFPGTGKESATAVVDKLGNVLVAGWFDGSFTIGGTTYTAQGIDAFVAKLDPSCALVWSHVWQGPGDGAAGRVAVDAAGNLYVTAVFEQTLTVQDATVTSSGGKDALIVKISPEGDRVWHLKVGGTGTQTVADVALDGAGDLRIVGSFEDDMAIGASMLSSPGVSSIFVARLDSDGEPVWVGMFGDGASPQFATDVSVEPTGTLAMTGLFSGDVAFGADVLSGGDKSGFVAALDADGNGLWAQDLANADATIAWRPDGDLQLSAAFSGTLTIDGTSFDAGAGARAMTAHLTPSGALVSGTPFGAGGVGILVATKPAFLANDTVLGYSSTLPFDFGGGLLDGPGGRDMYVARRDASGAHVDATVFGGPGHDVLSALAVTPTGEIVGAGSFQATVDFGTGPLMAQGQTNLFVVRWIP